MKWEPGWGTWWISIFETIHCDTDFEDVEFDLVLKISELYTVLFGCSVTHKSTCVGFFCLRNCRMTWGIPCFFHLSSTAGSNPWCFSNSQLLYGHVSVWVQHNAPIPWLKWLALLYLSASHMLIPSILLVFTPYWYLRCSELYCLWWQSDWISTKPIYLNFSAKRCRPIHRNLQKWFDLAHILLSTQVRVLVLPLAFVHEGTYNPVQAEGKYKPAENSLLTMCSLFCSYCQQQ